MCESREVEIYRSKEEGYSKHKLWSESHRCSIDNGVEEVIWKHNSKLLFVFENDVSDHSIEPMAILSNWLWMWS